MMSRRIVSRFAACSAVGGGILLSNDEGSRRSGYFWVNVFPIYLHYRSIQLVNRDLKIMSDERADKIYDDLHNRYTDRVKELTYELRGFYLKYHHRHHQSSLSSSLSSSSSSSSSHHDHH